MSTSENLKNLKLQESFLNSFSISNDKQMKQLS